jgi:hypothetical protein
LSDLATRVPLQGKELPHLIQCGALDGVGESRAALLAEAERMALAGGAGQLAFDFFQPPIVPDTAVERLAWERHILGMPVSVNPLDALADRLENCCPLPDLPQTGGRLVSVVGFRLPGWTGGPGLFLSDGRHYLIARLPQGAKAPKSWAIVRGRGRWRGDEWGGGWLELVGGG